MSALKFASETSRVPPGRMIGVKIDTTDVLLVNLDGNIVAFSNTCTHARCRLSQGELTGTVVKCPCHASKFDLLTGNVMAGPAVVPLRKVDSIIEEGRIMIKLA